MPTGKKSNALVPASQPVTLDVLDAMPVPPVRHATLTEMSEAQLGAMVHGLERTRERCDAMSGLCATLAGLVLIELKKRLDRGKFQPWIKEHFPKSYRTAAIYMNLATTFVKSAPRCTFDQMTLALMDGAQSLDSQSLDMTHPVVEQVAKWTKGRTFYQLREEELRGGGNHHPECPHCEGDLASKDQEICPHCGKETGEKEPTPEEQVATLRKQMSEWAAGHLTDDRVEKKLWRLLPDHETQALAARFRRLSQEMDEWLKMPAKRREEMSIEEVLG